MVFKARRRSRRPSAPASLLIRGAHVLTCDTENRTEVMDVRVDAGRISELGPSLSTKGVDLVVEATGLVLMPGFVQAHVHLCQTLFRAHADDMDLLTWLRERIWPFEGAHDEDTLRASAELGIAELLLNGTTTILDMGTVRHTDVLFETAQRMGIRYTGGKTLMDMGQGYPAGLRETTEEAVAESVRLCDTWQGAAGGRLRYAFSPRFALSCTEEALRRCVDEARARNVLLHTHASENPEEVELVRERTGMGNIEYLHHVGFTGNDVLLAHGIWVSSGERRILRETQTRVVHCPSANLKLGSGIARIVDFLEAGIPVALGADGAACNNGLDPFMEMRLAALLHKVRNGPTALPAVQALWLATRGGALAMGLEDVGTIAVGCWADLVLLDLNQPHVSPPTGDLTSRVVYSARSSDVHSVFVEGVPVVQERTLLTGSVKDIMHRATDASQALLARID